MKLSSAFCFHLVLFCLVASFAIFAEPSHFDAEWIMTKKQSRNSWKTILAPIKNVELVSVFGPQERFALVRGPSTRVSKFSSDVLAIQPNYKYSALQRNDPNFGNSWGLLNEGQSLSDFGNSLKGIDVGALKAWDIAAGSKKVTVAILDSGIDLSHEDLKNNLWINKLELEPNALDDDHNHYINDLNGWNFVDDNNNVIDDNNHGTAVAGVIASDSKNGKGTRGLLENSSMMIVKILDSNGTGSTERAVKGIEYAVRNGASVINASWGGTFFDQVLFDTIKWANDEGVLIVCAAGNEPKDNDTDERPIYPASFHLPNILSVAAHDAQGELAAFSSYGKESVHLAAPGVNIFTTTRGGYQWMNGTSFSAPFVTAAVALLKSVEPSFSPSFLKERLIQTAVPMDYYMKEKLSSGGRLNVYQALKNMISPKIPTPTAWIRVSKNLETAHPYSNDTKQTFDITQPGAKHLRVHFSKFELERQYDKVELKDNLGKLAMSYSGKLESFWSADVLGDTLRLQFISDFSNAEWGFSIDALEYSN